MDTTDQVRAAFVAESTAKAVLRQAQAKLDKAILDTKAAKQAVADAVIEIRPLGLMTVVEMAAFIGKRREFIDTLISESKAIATPVMVPPLHIDTTATPEQRQAACNRLIVVAAAHIQAKKNEKDARAERDRAVALAYQSKILRPSVIGTVVGMDRNHVGRVARKNGVPPLYRTNPQNQFTKQK